MPIDPVRAAEIRLVRARLLQARDPLSGDALAEAIAGQTDATREEIRAVLEQEETDP